MPWIVQARRYLREHMFVYRSVNDCVYQGCKTNAHNESWFTHSLNHNNFKRLQNSNCKTTSIIYNGLKLDPSVWKKQVLSRIFSKFHILALVFWQLTSINHNKPRWVSKERLDTLVSSQSLDLCFGSCSKYITSYEWPLIFQCCF